MKKSIIKSVVKPKMSSVVGVKLSKDAKPSTMPKSGMVKKAGGMSPSKPLSSAGKTKSLFGKKK